MVVTYESTPAHGHTVVPRSHAFDPKSHHRTHRGHRCRDRGARRAPARLQRQSAAGRAGRPQTQAQGAQQAGSGRPRAHRAVAGLGDGPSAVALDASGPAPVRQLIADCHRLAPHRGGMAKPMRVLICGVPNVGKSTLINRLSHKRQAKTGDEAGVTRQEQRITLADDFYLWDTPGMLWPRIIVPESGDHLAASGAIGRNAYDEELVALQLLRRLQRHYAPLLEARYRLGLPADALASLHDEELLQAIGRKRGAMQDGGQVNRQKTAEIVLTDFRSASLGRITLETTREFDASRAARPARDAERQASKDARRKARSAGQGACAPASARKPG